ncbi:MAG TPA: transglycosylase domain-containing protein [Acidimicrobiales bacterium]|nr:transglycosylase domain-containing protein [Acidimicrobiales bacterium]
MRLVLRILRVVFSSVYLTIVTVVAAPLVLVATVLAGLLFLPLPATIPVPKARAVALPSTVYSQDGRPIGYFEQASDQNVPVAESDIPDVVKEAVIADEDRNFYKHGGIDLRGTLRALLANLRNDKVVQGGSTIAQQYVKLAYLNSSRTLVRKVREAILASQLEREAPKSEILYRYLTLVYFGDGNYGVGAAAENYFKVPVSQLDASQAATLAGLIPAPSDRSPTVNIAAAEKYRELVLGKMAQQGYLTSAQYQQALASRLVAAPAPGQPAPPAGATVVYGHVVAVSPFPAFLDYLYKWLRANGYSDQQIYSGGLRIQTTMSVDREEQAMAAVGATIQGTPSDLEMAMASVEPQTGFVQAIVGGRDFQRVGDDNYALAGCDPVVAGSDPPATCWDGNDISNEGSPGRQPGSSWKPFVLATAFGQGIQPTATYPAPYILQIPGCTLLRGQPPSACQVHNDVEGEGGGSLTLAAAMAASVNTVYAQLVAQVGCANVARTAKALGVQSAYYSTKKFPYCQTYALGELDVSPLDMASAYGVFADHGQRAAPTPVLEIVGPTGKVLVDNITKPPATTQAIPANVADNVTNVLQGVLAPGGTAAGHPLSRPAAGKTGTTNNETNAWFTGYTPTLSTSVWMGFGSSQSKSLDGVKGVNPLVGGTLPAATWAAYMTQALANVPVTPFNQPAPIVAPTAAAALGSSHPKTPPTVGPGRADSPAPLPAGGPYTVPPYQTPQAVSPAEPVFPVTDTTTTLPTAPGGGPPPSDLGGSSSSSSSSSTSSTSTPSTTTTFPVRP